MKDKMKEKMKDSSFMMLLSLGVMFCGITIETNEKSIEDNEYRQVIESNAELSDYEHSLTVNDENELEIKRDFTYDKSKRLDNLNIMKESSKELSDSSLLGNEIVHMIIEDTSEIGDVDSLLVYSVFYNDILSSKSNKDIFTAETSAEVEKQISLLRNYLKELVEYNILYGDGFVEKFVEENYSTDNESQDVIVKNIFNVYKDLKSDI